MIPSLLAALLWCGPAWAQEADPGSAPPPSPDSGPPDGEGDDDLISRHRTEFETLTERAIGTTSTPVQFNWRRTRVHVAGSTSYLAELNNFNSIRVGGLARIPSKTLLVELGAAYAHTWDSPSSNLLALTPYRQPGRPSRLELDIGLSIPVAEGVVTTYPRFFPAVQLSWNLYAGLRYSVYPTGFREMKAGNILTAVLSPQLTEQEVDNLDDARLDSMQTDLGRYGLVAGFSNDMYLKQGFFISPRVLMGVPLLAPASGTELWFWADLNLVMGWAF